MSPPEERALLSLLSASRETLTPGRLVREAASRTGIPGNALRAALRRLVDQGVLAYAQHFGSTCVTFSFARPVRVTEHFILSPPDPDDEARSQDFSQGLSQGPPGNPPVTLFIEPGVAFGSGSHPTTRLCLGMIGGLAFGHDRCRVGEPVRAADIGTGSGVLAIAAMKVFRGACLAVDTDPNCVSEAGRNVRRNRLQECITVREGLFEPPPPSGPPLSLVLANLRFPTLKSLAPLLSRATAPGAFLALSGLRPAETAELLEAYSASGFSRVLEREETGWSGVLLVKA
jgi:ribosomal protein L11 methyltransferase